MTDETRATDEQLNAYLDGELGPEEAAQVERLLRTDPSAGRILEQFAVVSRLVAQTPAPAAPRDYRQAFPRSHWWDAVLAWTPALATATAVVLIAVGVLGALQTGGVQTPLLGQAETRSLAAAPAPAVEPAPERVAEVVTVEVERRVEVAAAPAELAEVAVAVAAESAEADLETPARALAPPLEREIEAAPAPPAPTGEGLRAEKDPNVAVDETAREIPAALSPPAAAGTGLDAAPVQVTGVAFWPFALGAGIVLLLAGLGGLVRQRLRRP